MNDAKIYHHPQACLCDEPNLGPRWCLACAPPAQCSWCDVPFCEGQRIHEVHDSPWADDVFVEICTKCERGD